MYINDIRNEIRYSELGKFCHSNSINSATRCKNFLLHNVYMVNCRQYTWFFGNISSGMFGSKEQHLCLCSAKITNWKTLRYIRCVTLLSSFTLESVIVFGAVPLFIILSNVILWVSHWDDVEPLIELKTIMSDFNYKYKLSLCLIINDKVCSDLFQKNCIRLYELSFLHWIKHRLIASHFLKKVENN